jgi:hypothetical protein
MFCRRLKFEAFEVLYIITVRRLVRNGEMSDVRERAGMYQSSYIN